MNAPYPGSPRAIYFDKEHVLAGFMGHVWLASICLNFEVTMRYGASFCLPVIAAIFFVGISVGQIVGTGIGNN